MAEMIKLNDNEKSVVKTNQEVLIKAEAELGRLLKDFELRKKAIMDNMKQTSDFLTQFVNSTATSYGISDLQNWVFNIDEMAFVKTS